jgi:hypothetical protein
MGKVGPLTKPLPTHIVDAGGRLRALPEPVPGMTREQHVEAQLRFVLAHYERVRAALLRQEKSEQQERDTEAATIAWEIANKAVSWRRGPVPKSLVSLIRRRVQGRLKAEPGKGGPLRRYMEEILDAVAPPASGPRGSALLIAKDAFGALSGKKDSAYRGVREPLRTLLLATKPKP